jgi:hypothetical protein
LLEPEPYSADRDIPDTEVIVVPSPSPVFVDSTGRRSRLLRRVAYAFGALCMLYGGLVSVSLAGGPVSSSAVLPLPNLPDATERVVEAQPIPTPTPSPASSGSPRALLVTEALPRRMAPATRDAGTRPLEATRTPRAGTTPTPSKTPKPTTPAAKPVESATTPANSAPPSPSTSVTTPAPAPGTVPPENPPAPEPPPVPDASSSGGGGGGGVAGPAPDPADAPAEEPAAEVNEPVAVEGAA